jgi:hypothetical protein
MKPNQLIVKLRKLADAHPDADLHFEWLEHVGNGTLSHGMAFVATRLIGGRVTISMARPTELEDVQRYVKKA